jgi:hypothetical protein
MINNIKSLFIALSFVFTILSYHGSYATGIVDNPSSQKTIEEQARERTERVVDYLALSKDQANQVYEVNLKAARKAKDLEKYNNKNKKARQREAKLLRQEMEKSYQAIFTPKQYKKHVKKQQAVEAAYLKQQNKDKRS